MKSSSLRILLILLCLIPGAEHSFAQARSSTEDAVEVRYAVPRKLSRVSRRADLACRIDLALSRPELRLRRGEEVQSLSREEIRRKLRLSRRRLERAGNAATRQHKLRLRWYRFLLKSDGLCALERNPCALELRSAAAVLSFSTHPRFGLVPRELYRGEGMQKTVLHTFAPLPLWRVLVGAGDVAHQPSELLPFRCDGLGEGGRRGSRLTWVGHPANGGAGVSVWLEIRPELESSAFTFRGGVEAASGATATAPINRFDFPQLYLTSVSADARLIKGVNVGVAIKDPLQNAYLHGAGGVNLGVPDPMFPETQTVGLDALVQGEQALALAVGATPERLSLSHFRSGKFDGGSLLMSIGRRIDDADKAQSGSLGESVLSVVDCPRRDICVDELGAWYRELIEPMLGPRVLEAMPPESLDRKLGLYVLLGAARGGARSDFDSHLEYLQKLEEKFGVTPAEMGLNIFDWTGRSFDAGTPGYIESPPDPLLPGFVSELRSRGYGAIAGYTRMAQWDATLASYANLNLREQGAVIRRDGSIDENEQQIVIVDPAAPTVRQHFVQSIAEQLTRVGGMTGGFSAFFLDAFPLALPCYAENHGHKVGGAHSFWPAVHGLVDDLRNRLEAERGESFLIAEAGSEALVGHSSVMNFYHPLIPFGLPASVVELVDLIGAFKHHTPIGHIALVDIPGDDALFFYPWVKVAARDGDPTLLNFVLDAYRLDLLWMFVQGRVHAVVRRPLNDPFDGSTTLLDDARLGEISDIMRSSLRMLNHAELRGYLFEGEVVPGISLQSAPVTDVLFGDRLLPRGNDGSVPSVLGRLYRSRSDGSIAIALGNWRPEARRVSIEVDTHSVGLGSGASLQAEMFSALLADGVVRSQSVTVHPLAEGQGIRVEIDLPPLTPTLIRLREVLS